jgi:ParB family chromosome partitioning protein
MSWRCSKRRSEGAWFAKSLPLPAKLRCETNKETVMAKRKRLTPPVITPSDAAETESIPGGLETKSMQTYPLGVHPPIPASRPPIAQVAGDASNQAALEEVAQELQSARSQGRMVQALPLEAIKADHLVRDRLALDASEMEALKTSLHARGQQTPIEVVDLGQGAYGLISGLRRLTALKELQAGGGEIAHIQALIKPIDTVSDSYVAMVEENEIRANLSFYERARLAAEASKLGVYPTAQRAVQALFASASSSKRSKIITFLTVHAALDSALQFPSAIPERVGLALAGAIEADTGFAPKLRDALRKNPAEDAKEERAALERALTRVGKAKAAPKASKGREVAPGVRFEAQKGRVVLSGQGVTPQLQEALALWLAEQ